MISTVPEETTTMTENRRQVLEMLAAGRITAEDAERLLGALDSEPGRGATTQTAEARPRPRYLRVVVDVTEPGEGPVHVNVRVPLVLIRAGVRLASLIPMEAQSKINVTLKGKGIDFDISQLRAENLDQLIDQLENLTVDVEQRDNVRVKVSFE